MSIKDKMSTLHVKDDNAFGLTHSYAFGVAVLGCLAAYISVMTRRALKEIRAAKAEWPQAA